MKFTKSGTKLPEFLITPMMDVVFLLLCFFVTTAVYSQWEYEIDIALPTAQSGAVPERLPGEIIINLNKDGVININQRTYTNEELLSTCQKLSKIYEGHPVVIRADRETAYEHVIHVIDICKTGGIRNVSFATISNSSAVAIDNPSPVEIQ